MRMIFIGGMHRSGTSFLARSFLKNNFVTSKRLDVNYEPIWLQRLNEKICFMLGGDWRGIFQSIDPNYNNIDFDIVVGFLKKEINKDIKVLSKHNKPFLYKDPRISLLINIYNVVFPNSIKIHVLRKPSAVVDSLYRRDLNTSRKNYNFWLNFYAKTRILNKHLLINLDPLLYWRTYLQYINNIKSVMDNPNNVILLYDSFDQSLNNYRDLFKKNNIDIDPIIVDLKNNFINKNTERKLNSFEKKSLIVSEVLDEYEEVIRKIKQLK